MFKLKSGIRAAGAASGGLIANVDEIDQIDQILIQVNNLTKKEERPGKITRKKSKNVAKVTIGRIDPLNFAKGYFSDGRVEQDI